KPQRESTHVMIELEVGVSVEASRISERRPRTSGRVIGILAWITEINEHRLPAVCHDRAGGGAQRHKSGRVEPLLSRLLITWQPNVPDVSIVDQIPKSNRRSALEGVNTLELPAADEPRDKLIRVSQEFLDRK